MVEDLICQWLRRRTKETVKPSCLPIVRSTSPLPLGGDITPRGYNSQELFREDTLLRIKRLQSDANDCARRMNEIILKGNLPEKPVQLPFPEDDDAECE